MINAKKRFLTLRPFADLTRESEKKKVKTEGRIHSFRDKRVHY